MSILPPRTSPSTQPGTSSAGEFSGAHRRLDPVHRISDHQNVSSLTVFLAEWRVRFPDEASDQPVKKTILRVNFGWTMIRFELLDLQGKRLSGDTFDVSRTEHLSGDDQLIQWTVNGQSRPIARLMTNQNGDNLLLRTNLPEQLGFAGGRHDLTDITKSGTD